MVREEHGMGKGVVLEEEKAGKTKTRMARNSQRHNNKL